MIKLSGVEFKDRRTIAEQGLLQIFLQIMLITASFHWKRIMNFRLIFFFFKLSVLVKNSWKFRIYSQMNKLSEVKFKDRQTIAGQGLQIFCKFCCSPHLFMRNELWILLDFFYKLSVLVKIRENSEFIPKRINCLWSNSMMDKQ